MFADECSGLGGPFERLGVGVLMREPFGDGDFEFVDTPEHAPPNALAGDLGEQPPDEVEP